MLYKNNCIRIFISKDRSLLRLTVTKADVTSANAIHYSVLNLIAFSPSRRMYKSSPLGLSTSQAATAFQTNGPNLLTKRNRPGLVRLVIGSIWWYFGFNFISRCFDFLSLSLFWNFFFMLDPIFNHRSFCAFWCSGTSPSSTGFDTLVRWARVIFVYSTFY